MVPSAHTVVVCVVKGGEGGTLCNGRLNMQIWECSPSQMEGEGGLVNMGPECRSARRVHVFMDFNCAALIANSCAHVNGHAL